MPWPLPALLAWALTWAVFFGLRAWGLPMLLSLPLATLVGLLCAWPAASRWRQIFIAGGFPLSAMLLVGPAGLPAATWLLPLGLLLLLYPMRSWRDAPLFPTPPGALAGLAAAVPLPPGAAVLEAGCGLGHGLRALREQYPQARLHGLELSRPLAVACRWRCRFANVRRGSLWQADWSAFQMVYLFQRPETMARAAAKAAAELPAGGWLVSLEFPVPGWQPQARLEPVSGKPVWAYAMPPQPIRR
jgi:hypothetical protein